MNWSEASSYYQSILKSILNVQRHALYVSEIKATGVNNLQRKALIDGIDPIKRQLNRLEKGEFRIAVVGLEKSGKSTFVNAWLECDLLPTASKRCTFTTTQIYSVNNENEQKLEIITKSKEQFNQLQIELKQASKGSHESARRASEDLGVIEQNKKSLYEVIQNGNQTIPFTRIEEISNNLYKYVADVRFAHAIEEVRLFTSRLAETDGIVFFDVPGLNSGLGKHLEESRAMLTDCDAVICIQDSRRPSLEAHEQKLVEFVKEGDELVGISGKLFVFAGQIDLHGSSESLFQDYQEICNEWNKRCKLPNDHIIFGSSAAYLLLIGAAGVELRNRVGNVEDISRKLSLISENNEISSIENIEVTGIPAIRKRIKHYLNEERVQVLKKRCDEPIKRIIETSNEIYIHLKQNFSENPDEARRQEANRLNIKFEEWWSKKWGEIEPLVNRYFKEHFDTESKDEEIESVKQLHDRFNQLVHEELSQLTYLDPKKIQDIFDKNSRPVFDAQIANDAWRELLYDKDITEFLHDKLSKKLSIELLKDCQSYVDFISNLLWDSVEVQRFMIDKEEEFRLQLESGLRSLFLRFARPIAEALIRGPLGSARRNNIYKKLSSDIEMLQNFYDGREPEYEKISRYITWGIDLINNPVVRKMILGIAPVTAPLLMIANIKNSEELKPKIAASPEEIIEEVKSDISAFEKYLKDIIFNAAGFASYLSQELKRLRDRFASNSYYWHAIARNEYECGNSRLLNELPDEFKNTEFDIEISDRLRQLRLAIEEFKGKESFYSHIDQKMIDCNQN